MTTDKEMKDFLTQIRAVRGNRSAEPDTTSQSRLYVRARLRNLINKLRLKGLLY